MGVMIMNGSDNRDYIMTAQCVQATATFSSNTGTATISSTIPIMSIYISQFAISVLGQNGVTYTVSAQTYDPMVLFEQEVRLDLLTDDYNPQSTTYTQINVILTRNNNNITIQPQIGKITNGQGELVMVDHIISGSMIYSNGGGSTGVGIMALSENWATFPYGAVSDGLSYSLSDIDSDKVKLKNPYWLPLQLEFYNQNNDTCAAQFDFWTGQYTITSGSFITAITLNLETPAIHYSLTGTPLNRVYGRQWIAIAGHHDYYPDQLIMVTNASNNIVTNKINNNSLVIQQQSYTFNSEKYKQRPYDALIISATNGGYGWNLSGSSALEKGNVMRELKYQDRGYDNEDIHKTGIMCITPYWDSITPANATAVLSSNRKAMTPLNSNDALAINTSPSSQGNLSKILMRSGSNIAPIPLHYTPLSITYSTGGWSGATTGYAGNYIGMDDNYLYLDIRNNSYDPCFCYAYRSEPNIKSFIGTTALSQIYGYMAKCKYAHYFWVDDVYYACASNGNTWQIAVLYSSDLWGHLPDNVFSFANNTQVTKNGMPVYKSNGSAATRYEEIINGEHYYTQN